MPFLCLFVRERKINTQHSNVYEKAVQIIERFYGCDDEEEDDADVAPNVADGAAAFSFGMTNAPTPNKAPSSCGVEMNNSPCGGGGMGGMPMFGSPVRTLNFA